RQVIIVGQQEIAVESSLALVNRMGSLRDPVLRSLLKTRSWPGISIKNRYSVRAQSSRRNDIAGDRLTGGGTQFRTGTWIIELRRTLVERIWRQQLAEIALAHECRRHSLGLRVRKAIACPFFAHKEEQSLTHPFRKTRHPHGAADVKAEI